MIKGFVRFGDDKPKELGWYCIKNISPNGYHWYDGTTFVFNNEPMGVHDNVLWLDESIEEQPGEDAISFAEWIQKSSWIKSVTNPGKILWFDGKSEMYDKPYITTYQLYNIYKNRPQ